VRPGFGITIFDALRQQDFLFCGEKRGPGDFPQVELQTAFGFVCHDSVGLLVKRRSGDFIPIFLKITALYLHRRYKNSVPGGLKTRQKPPSMICACGYASIID
jgi:hypothetical protein